MQQGLTKYNDLTNSFFNNCICIVKQLRDSYHLLLILLLYSVKETTRDDEEDYYIYFFEH